VVEELSLEKMFLPKIGLLRLFIDGFKKNPLNMSILGQKSCSLGHTIFEIAQTN